MTCVQVPDRRIRVRTLGRCEYEPTWRAMQAFTEARNADTLDEVWLTEHPSVFTLGLNANRTHLLNPGDIPVIAVDRGGQVTYHGPGQIMIYPMVDLRRRKLGIRGLVTALEQAAIRLLLAYDVTAAARRDAPGVYVDGRKIASVGLRIRRGASFHGMAFNVDVDVAPFSRINPCGFVGLEVTNCRREGVHAPIDEIRNALTEYLLDELRCGAAVEGH